MEIGNVRSALFVTDVSAPAAPVERPPERIEVIEAVKAINRAEYFSNDQELTFVFDRNHRAVLRIVDRKTGEVVRQVPAEHVLRVARQINRDEHLEYA